MKKKILLLFLVLALALTAAGAAVSACAENVPEETRQSEPAPEPQEDHTENAPFAYTDLRFDAALRKSYIKLCERIFQ